MSMDSPKPSVAVRLHGTGHDATASDNGTQSGGIAKILCVIVCADTNVPANEENPRRLIIQPLHVGILRTRNPRYSVMAGVSTTRP